MPRALLFPAVLIAVAATLPGAAQATSTTCTTAAVCAEYINSSSGVAIHGEANSGIGVRGTSVSDTGFYGASGSGSYLTPGVEGESTNTMGSDAAAAFGLGYLATGNAPQFGALAYGRGEGLYGESESPGTSSNYGYGVFGRETQGSSAGDYSGGVLGESSYGVGVLAESNGTPSYNIAGDGEPVGLYSVAKTNGNNGALGIEAESNGTAFQAVNTAAHHGQVEIGDPNYVMEAEGSSGVFFTFDYSGNELITGGLTTAKGSYVRTAGSDGTQRIAYADRTATPQIEDVGEGTLTNGRGIVAIDAALGDSIDMRRAYHVFLTPEGDCKGLYVAQKSPAGFVVRELQGGRSSIAFEYRIVAKPLDEDGRRLAVAPPMLHPTSVLRATDGPRSSSPAAPQDILRRQIGSQRYAKALAALRSRVTANGP